jgi:hypothetical protein
LQEKAKKSIVYSLSIVFSIITFVCLAHEFWLQPNKYFFTNSETATIRFNVGEHFTGENWKGNKNKIQQLLHYTPNNSINNISSSLSNAVGDSIKLPITEEGTHMIVFNSTNSYIQLEAEKFTNYLIEDGLLQALAFRKSNGEDTLEGKEYYQRCVKTIFQCGRTTTNACTKATSLPLDIILGNNPYQIEFNPATRELQDKNRFRVCFKSAPLIKHLVKHWYKDATGKVKCDNFYTNKKGWISIQQQKGVNMVSCVYMERIQQDTSAQWQSYWGSVTFETPKGNSFIKNVH